MTDKEFIQAVSMPGEEWKTIPNWERYIVSSFGRIIALSAPYKCGNRICRRKPQLLNPRATNIAPSYLSVVLSDGNRTRKSSVVHRLVASAFIPNPMKLPYINHKDENPMNNCVKNLEWCTQEYNCNYGTHNLRMAKTISETAYQKRAVVQLSLTGEYVNTFASIKDAAQALGIERASISICCRKPNRTGRGFRWMYQSDYESRVSMSKNSNTNS